MEPLWSPVVANGGSRRQIDRSQKPRKQAKSVATGCHRLRATFHGKEGVDGSSPSEGSAKALLSCVSPPQKTCMCSNLLCCGALFGALRFGRAPKAAQKGSVSP